MAIQKVNLKNIAGGIGEDWKVVDLADVNDSVVRLSVLDRQFHWHAHENEDEFFFVVEGVLTIDIEGQEPVLLSPGEGLMAPKGMRHRTGAATRTITLLFEKKTLQSAGD